jgi:hypothetical protein
MAFRRNLYPENLLDFADVAKLVPVQGPINGQEDYYPPGEFSECQILSIATQRGIQTRNPSDTEIRMRLRQSDIWTQLVRDGNAFVRRWDNHQWNATRAALKERGCSQRDMTVKQAAEVLRQL